MKIFSNIHLYKIPYIYVNSVDKLRKMEDGYVILDELWSIIKARCPMSKQNQIVGDIILRSRKKHLTYVFTSQLLSLIDKNIRSIVDFMAYPVLNPQETICMLSIFKGSTSSKHHLKTIYFKTELPMMMYDTDEIVDMKEKSEDEMQIRFQVNFNKEHGHFCTCDECGGRVFKTWEEAEKVANEYWYRLYKRGEI